MDHRLNTSMANSQNLPSVLAASLPEYGKRVTRSTNIVSSYLFVDNVRFLSMAAIICMHTTIWYFYYFQGSPIQATLNYLIQPLKFGTIGFFLISGFLIGRKINQYSPLQYFRRRLRNVFVPWCVWYFMSCGLRICADFVNGRASDFNFKYLVGLCQASLFMYPFWFVPNLLVAMAILLTFHRFLNDVRIGLVFLSASLFYGVNIYGCWIETGHTRAVFGFVFYLWLGAWGAWHFPELQKRVTSIPAGVMLGGVLFALSFAFAESKLLVMLGHVDPLNTLRISNQIYSIVIVLAIMKVRFALWPSVVNVREHTFGLYLTHTVAQFCLWWEFKPIFRYFAAAPLWVASIGTVILIPTLFILIYGGCLLVVQILLAYPKLRWTVGLSGKGHQVDKKNSDAVVLRKQPCLWTGTPDSADMNPVVKCGYQIFHPQTRRPSLAGRSSLGMNPLTNDVDTH
jgi:peptidoglycan/LPS O-acetylase OafA/YrhL